MSIEKSCQYCGAEYTAERDSAKYCSNSCKTLACRQRRENERIAYLQEQKRIEIDRIYRQEAADFRILKEQFEAKWAEQDQKLEEERKQREEHQIKEMEQHLALKVKHRKREREKRIKKNNDTQKLKIIGTAAAVQLGYLLIESFIGSKNNLNMSQNKEEADSATKSQDDE
jgi:hypothetical protein